MARTFHVFDLIILGSGAAGFAALKEARKHSDNILLIHGGPRGNSCGLAACMPARALMHAANLFHKRLAMQEVGIEGAASLHADLPAILAWARDQKKRFAAESTRELKRYEAQIVEGRGVLTAPTTVRAAGRLFHGKAIIIATGSAPQVPPEWAVLGDRLLTPESLIELPTLPRRIGVVGLGPVGLEMAQAMARLGVEVTAIDRSAHVGGLADPDINREVLALLREEMRVHTGATLKFTANEKSVTLKTRDTSCEVDAVLLAAIRKPNLASLGLKRLGLPLDGEGVPHFNRKTMQVHGFPIFMAGDVTDERAMLHEAYDEGRRAAYHALTGDTQNRPRMTPLTIISTKPTIAIIGDSHHAMRWNGIKTGEAFFTQQECGMIEECRGKVMIAADKVDGTIRGCEMMAPGGEHLAHLIALAIEQQLTAAQLLASPIHHPSFEAGLKPALQAIA